MDYTELYAQKKMTADQAAALVKSGDWVDYGWAVNTPVAVDAAIAKRLPELENVNFRGGILMWVPEIFQIDDPAAHMTWNSWHMGGIERKAIAQGFSFYSPIRYSELPRYYRESPDPLDVAVFQVTPMDEHGYFNFGPSASHLGAVCEKAKKIIVEVNKNMPRCLGGMENCVHISQVTGIVDYAHTHDAVVNVLTAIREVVGNRGRIITVVGAGGNRDKGKRPIMAREAARLSDFVILTSDNPRFEEPEEILHDMEAGIADDPALSTRCISVTDRRTAIERAAAMAGQGDVVLVAGKGHEDYQEVRGVKHHFDDREEIVRALAAR